MNFFLVDDDITTRTMLKEIIHDHELGIVIGEAEDGSLLDHNSLALKKSDILIIDLLMPTKDGIETVEDIKSYFTGKVIMISQVVSKNMISSAYSKGVEYYITKPLNKYEIETIINKVSEKIKLENSIANIHKLTQTASKQQLNPNISKQTTLENDFDEAALAILSQIGIIGENGYKDILDILNYMFNYDQKYTLTDGIPALKDIFIEIITEKSPDNLSEQMLKREIKSTEQRIRRAIDQSLSHLASLGLTDYLNPTFEAYSSRLFNFTVVRERMTELKENQPLQSSNVQINNRKFLQSLYFEIKKII